MQRILVIEDRSEFLRAAEECFNMLDVEAEYVSKPNEALETMQKGALDGILLDMFMPTGPYYRYLAEQALGFLEHFEPHEMVKRAYMKSLQAIKAEIDEEAPVGVLIAEDACQKGIPFVIVTSLNHHSEKFEAIYQYIQASSWALHEGWRGKHIVGGTELIFLKDDPQLNKDRPEFWKKAYEKLLKRIR